MWFGPTEGCECASQGWLLPWIRQKGKLRRSGPGASNQAAGWEEREGGELAKSQDTGVLTLKSRLSGIHFWDSFVLAHLGHRRGIPAAHICYEQGEEKGCNTKHPPGNMEMDPNVSHFPCHPGCFVWVTRTSILIYRRLKTHCLMREWSAWSRWRYLKIYLVIVSCCFAVLLCSCWANMRMSAGFYPPCGTCVCMRVCVRRRAYIAGPALFLFIPQISAPMAAWL